MDPTETYQVLRAAITYMSEHMYENLRDMETWIDYAIDARDAFNDLDQWLTRGGFHPTAWSHNTAHLNEVPGMDGRLGFIDPSNLRPGDALTFPTRVAAAVDTTHGLQVRVTTSGGTETLGSGHPVLAFRHSDTARQREDTEACTQCGAEPGEACEPGCLVPATADDDILTHLTTHGLRLDAD